MDVLKYFEFFVIENTFANYLHILYIFHFIINIEVKRKYNDNGDGKN